MSAHNDRPDQPAVSNPQLSVLVELARSQSLSRRKPDFEAIHAAVLAAHKARRRRMSAYVGLAIAAALAALVLVRLDLFRGDQSLSISTGTNGHVAQDMRSGPAETATVPATPAPSLTAAARVTADTTATPSPTVLGTWEVALAPGRYSVEVDEHPGAEALQLHAQGGVLELHHGRVLMIVGASHTEVALQQGVGVWVASDGRREPLLAAGETPSTALADAAAPDVSALARRAEELLTAGKRDAAIKQLGQIVTEYPQHPTARAALLDLAPLLGAAGRVDESRCAYRLYLDRYPGKQQLADQVAKALTRLGEGPDCRGLKPQ